MAVTTVRQAAAPELVERDAELAALERALDRAADGTGGLAVVEGPAGIGKSALLAALRTRADAHAAEFATLRASGGELERDYAYGVVRQLLERTLAAARKRDRTELLDGAAALAAPLFGYGSAVRDPGEADPGFSIVHGLYWLVANIAERSPLLLEVDDAHWADAPSLRFLAYLARRLEGLPVLLAVGTRPSEPGAETGLLAELVASGPAEFVEPRVLSRAGASKVLATQFGRAVADPFASACHDATGGNPYLLAELAHALCAEDVTPDTADAVAAVGPRAVSRSVLLRLGRLPQECGALARAVALLGNDVAIRHAAALSDLDEKRAATAARTLVDAQLLAPERQLRFVHPIVRTAVYEDLSDAERAIGHARAADLLADDGQPPDRIATHLLAAEPRVAAGAVDTLRAAARSASEGGSTEIAGRYLARALEEQPPPAVRAELLGELGTAEYRAGTGDAAGHLRESIALTEDPSVGALSRMMLVRVLAQQGDFAGAVATMAEAAELARPVEAEMALRFEAERATMAMMVPPAVVGREAVAALAKYDDLQGDTRAERALLASMSAAAWQRCEPADDAVDLARRALGPDRRLVPESGADSPQAYHAAYTLMLAEELDEAKLVLDDLVTVARARGSLFGFCGASAFRAALLARRGELASAEADARVGFDAAKGHNFVSPFSVAWLAYPLVMRGDLDAADEAFATSGYAGEIPMAAPFIGVAFARALLRFAQGDLERAAADADTLEQLEAALEMHTPGMPTRCARARVLHACGHVDDARAAVKAHLEQAERWGRPGAIGTGLATQGVVEGGDEGIELLARGVAELERSPLRLELARARFDLGSALRRANRRKDAREELQRSLELAQRCGALALAERARQELKTAGARPRRLMFSGAEALTASERRVATMAAEGMTNREIAQALFLTVRTVENHLARAYPKLGIHSRDELADALKS